MNRIIAVLIALALVTVPFLPLSPVSAVQTREVWLYGADAVEKDAHTDEANPTTNFATSTPMFVEQDVGERKSVFIDLELANLPSSVAADGSNIEAYELYLYIEDYAEQAASGDDIFEMLLRRVTSSWTETGITHNNRPARTTYFDGIAFHKSGVGQFWKLTFTDLVKKWLDGTFSDFGFSLEPNDANEPIIDITSSEGSVDYTPHVRLVYTTTDDTVHASFSNAFSGLGIPFEQFKLFVDTSNPPTTRRFSPTFTLVDGITHFHQVEDFFGNVIEGPTSFVPNSDPFFLDISLSVTDLDIQFSDRRRHHLRFEDAVSGVNLHTNLTPIPLFADRSYNLEVLEDDDVFGKPEFGLPDIDGFQQTVHVAVAPKSLSELYGNQTVEMHALRLDNPSAGTQYISLAHSATFDRTDSDVTLAAWVRPHEIGRFQRVGGKQFIFGQAYGFAFDSSNRIRMDWRNAVDGAQAQTVPSTDFTIEQDRLYFVAGSWDDTGTGVTLNLYVDEDRFLVDVARDERIGDNGEPYRIARTGDTSNFANLTVADWQQYNRALTDADVRELHARGPQGAPLENRDLVLHWPLADTWSGLAHDYSGGDFHGSLVGDPASVKIPTPGRTTVHFSFFDALGQPHPRQDWLLYWGTQRVPNRVASGILGTSLNWSVRDLWGNLVASGTHAVDDDPDFVDIVLTGIHNFKIGNEEQELFILTELRHTSSSTERAEFLFPLEVTSLWLVAGDYVLNVTPYTTACKDATASGCVTGTLQSYSFTVGSAEAFLVSGEATARRLIDDLTVQGDRQEFVWDQTNKTWRRVRDLATPAGVALVFDSYFIPDWTRLPILQADLAPGAVIDPFRTLIYESRNSTEAATADLWRPWDLSWPDADVDVLRDDLFLAIASGTVSELWINDTADTEATGDDTNLLDVTFIPAYVDLLAFGDGLNVSVEAAGGGTVNATRVSQVRFVSTFLWSQDSVTRRWSMSTTLPNDLSVGWTNLMVHLAFPEQVTVDPATVVVRDVGASVDLDLGVHYDLTSGGVVLGLRSLDSEDEKTWRVTFSGRTEGSFVTEPACTFGRPTTERRGLVDMNRVEVTCTNTLDFTYRGRVVLAWDPSRPVDHGSIIVEDTSGNRLPGPVFWNDAHTLIVQNMQVDALSSTRLVVWFRYVTTDLTPAAILPYAPWATGIFAALAIISYVAWSRERAGSDRFERARTATTVFGLLTVASFFAWIWSEVALG